MNKNILLYTNSDDNWYTNTSFHYLLGFQPSLWFIFISQRSLHIILDSRYFGKTKNVDTKVINKRLWEKLEVKFILLDREIEKL